ncbi:MAG: beta-propeller fold lactonase family protein [Bdellovibrionaceae bacterium]|nr:beta-propeller fold lactonase family protein [Pseudobdellovibrionaceae bacterium]
MRSLVFLFIASHMAWSAETPRCENKKADEKVQLGYVAQAGNRTLEAVDLYTAAMTLDPNCADVLYEIGWSFWKLGEWQKVVTHWESALKLKPNHKLIPQFMPAAKDNLKIVSSGAKTNQFRKNVDLFSQSLPEESPVKLSLVHRWQSYNAKPEFKNDHYDQDIFSPKSVSFSEAGDIAFVQSLEGAKTLFFKSDGSEKMATIKHQFDKKSVKELVDRKQTFTYKNDPKMFQGFTGKPVESIVTHDGKYLWTTYYRKNYDELGQQTSAVAIIDIPEKKIVRVMGTGPISKYVEKSPDQKWLAISNWGDNTVGIYNISGTTASEFKEHQLLIVEKKHSLKNLKSNRDKDCGFCVRGLAFSPDSQYLFVTRMKGGGISIFKKGSANKFELFGTAMGLQPGPRDIHFSKDGKDIFIGCNSSGTIAKISLENFVNLFEKNVSKTIDINDTDFKFIKKFIGLGVRSFKVHPKFDYLFLTSNNGSEIIIAKSSDLSVLGRVPVDSYPVGLSISPDGKYLWVTSQGKDSQGGNSVSVFLITEYLKNQIKI